MLIQPFLARPVIVWCHHQCAVGAGLAYGRGWPDSWKTADWSSSGVLPKISGGAEARVYILAARTGRWKSIFAEHLSIVLKRAGEPAWTRY